MRTYRKDCTMPMNRAGRFIGRVERGSFTLTLSQNRAWKSPLTRLFTLNTLCIDITLGADLYATCHNAIDRLLHCRVFDASACTPTPRDLLSSHWQLRLHLIWKVANPLYIDVRLVAHGQWPVPCTCNEWQLGKYDEIGQYWGQNDLK